MNNEPTSNNQDFERLHKAYQLLSQMEGRLIEAEKKNGHSAPEPVAIIGMACRLPGGSDTPDKFWHLLKEGKNVITEVPKSRWDGTPTFDANVDAEGDANVDAHNNAVGKWGGFVQNADCFDPWFFNISPREAELMDPQQRLFLQECWHAIEDAGYDPLSLSNSQCGVYAGVFSQEYAERLNQEDYPADSLELVGNHRSILAARVSYFLNLKGPAISLDTACSSSAVAIHTACRAIQNGEVAMALAGGVSLYANPRFFVLMNKLGMLSEHGQCFTFDTRANGFSPAEGVGVLMLKSLSQAQRDGDQIHSIIRASGINQDGRSNGITAPNVLAQTELIEAVYEEAGIDPESITYVEAHGTGTPLGDPIEVEALTTAFRKQTDKRGFCAIGSAKTNIGHTQAAAGVTGVIKAVLACKHKQIPPSLNYETPNPHIDFEDTPFYVNTKLKEWPALDEPRRAGVSSFGFSGVNTHFVIEEYAEEESKQREVEEAIPHLIVLSARDKERLTNYVQEMLAFLPGAPEVSLADLAYTLQVGRAALETRIALVVSSKAALIEKLTLYEEQQNGIDGVVQGAVPKNNPMSTVLLDGEAGTAFLQVTIQNRELMKLAQLWVSGVQVDWSLLYGQETPKRISLPTYPFARERYWLPERNEVVTHPDTQRTPQKDTSQAGASQEIVEVSTYRTVWQLDDSTEQDSVQPIAATVLILYHDREFAEAAESILEVSQLIPLRLSSHAEKQGADWGIDAEEAQDYVDLLEQLKREQLTPTHIVYQGLPYHQESATRDQNLHRRNMQILYHCATALNQTELRSATFILLYGSSESTRSSAPETMSYLESLGGYARSLALMGLDFRKVCVHGAMPTGREQLHALSRELRQLGVGSFHEILYRENQRYLRAVEPLPLPSNSQSLLKQGGVYWITGGGGGLGMIFARYLAERYQASLILTGRSELHETLEAKLAALRQLGAYHVTYHQGDVADRDQMQVVLARIKSEFGELNGVIHAAGIQSTETTQPKTWRKVEQTLAPKIEGTLNLDEVTKGEALDFFALFSSTSAVVGDFGYGDYAIANRFMDEYAQARAKLVKQKQRHGKTISINWPLWREGGMKLSLQGERLYLQSSGQSYLDVEDGIRLFEQSLKLDQDQVIIFVGQTQRIRQFLGLEEVLRQANDSRSVEPLDADLSQEIGSVDPVGPDLNTQRMHELILATLTRQVAAVAKMNPEQVDEHENLGDLGFDSIMLKQLATKIEQQYHISLTPAIFFDYSDLHGLAGFLMVQHQAAVESYYESERTREKSSHAAGDALQETFTLPQTAPRETDRAQGAQIQAAKPRQSDSSYSDSSRSEPIAIVGMSGMMPQSPDLTTFWQHLEAGHDLITEIPSERWDWRATYENGQPKPYKTVSKWGGFVPDMDAFDPLFFKISPREAKLMDPQHRLFLQVAWHCIEDAGYCAWDWAGRPIGVYVGIQFQEYESLIEDAIGQSDGCIPTGNAQAMIANRLSYLLDLRGPSEAIDTACSSSLVALHRAVQSIRSGEIESAIVGGVSLALSPTTFVSASQMGVLSPDGRCKTFDSAANGYVRGEGVGAVLLKPLTQAQQDCDHIYAVIRGSAENHGGRATSLTAPNAQAQAQLLVQAYEDADIDIGTVSYIETHGTGTELGDPVEIEGLKRGFAELRAKQGQTNQQKQQPYCGLGAVKTNIGHLEPAAGIAGLFKVLLALKHQRLPATIHFTEQNPHIRLTESPFYLVTETQAWEPLIDDAGEPIPRRAGASSFGFGGTNAHVVLEEYDAARWQNGKVAPSQDGAVSECGQPQVIVLSAKNEDRLREYAHKLLTYLEDISNRLADHTTLQPCNPSTSSGQVLPNIAFTLQVGRDAMDSRLALVVMDIESLREKLTAYLAGETAIEQCFQGSVKEEKERIAHLSEDEDGRALIRQWLQKGRLTQLASVWVKGLAIEWQHLHQAENRYRMSLPTYPFAKDRYWIPEPEQPKPTLTSAPFADQRLVSRVAVTENVGFHSDRSINGMTPSEIHDGVLHPLIHKNTSTFTEQRFTTTFLGNEFFLRDHQVQGESVLPGVVYLEMAQAGAEIAVEGERVTQLRNVVWVSPITVGNNVPVETHLALYQDERQGVCYEVRTLDDDGKSVLHGQGKLGFDANFEQMQVIDLEAIRQRCPEAQSGQACYQQCQRQGLTYGPTFQVIEEVISNEREVLARLQLPDEVADGPYILHPSLLDGVLQSVVGLTSRDSELNEALYLPFALDLLELVGPIPAMGYAYATKIVDSDTPINLDTAHFNIALLDDKGRVSLKLHNFTLKVASQPQPGWYYAPDWVQQRLPDVHTLGADINTNEANGTIVLVTSKEMKPLGERLRQHCSPRQVVQLILGEQNVQLDQSTWELDQTNDEGWKACLSALNTLPEVITLYFLGGLSARHSLNEMLLPTRLDELDQIQERGVVALFRLIKFLEQQGLMPKLSAIKVLTNCAQQSHLDAPILPWNASVSGFTMSLAKEYSGIDVSCIDVVLTKDNADKPTFHEADLLAIIAECNSNGHPIALRNGVRYVRQLIPLTLPDATQGYKGIQGTGSDSATWPPYNLRLSSDRSQATFPYRQGGVYLILGGAGGIGLETAVHLAKKVQANVVLVGRSVLTAEKEVDLNRIKEVGGNYLYCQADCTHLAEMQAVVRKVKARFGVIHGVIHSAMVLQDRSIFTMDEVALRAVMAPKVTGTIVLADVTKDEPLDFMLFFSSGQSFWGNAGQSNYAAGSTFQDAYAHYLNQRKLYPVKVINWGYWGSVGAVATDAYEQRLAQQGIHSISAADGMAAIDQVLSSPLAQVAAMKADRSALAQMHVAFSQQAEVVQLTYGSSLQRTVEQLTADAQNLDVNQTALQKEQAGFKALENFAQRSLLQILQQMGILQVPGETSSQHTLRQQLHILPKYERLFAACLQILEMAGYVRQSDPRVETMTLATEEEALDMAQQEADLAHRYPMLRPYLTLLTTCLQALPKILQGQIPATNIIFPNSSLALVEGIYHGIPTKDYHNHMVALAVKNAVEQRLPALQDGEKIQIVEIGAGTGGTSEVVLSAIESYGPCINYLFSDISQGFIHHSQRRFGQRYPFVTFGLLDVENVMTCRVVELSSADIVFGTDVVHATKNIQQTLRNLKSLHKANGLLILNETSEFTAFTTLTFGLLDGWWAFEDEDLRIEHTPLLSPTQWMQALGREGFAPVHVTSQRAEWSAHQAIVLAESDGILRLTQGATSLPQWKPVQPKPMTNLFSETAQSELSKGRPKAFLPQNMHQALVAKQIIQIISDYLHIQIDHIEADMPYVDLGIDSILAVEIINQINERLNITLRTTDLFNYADIQSLSAHITATFPEELSLAVTQESVAQELIFQPTASREVVFGQAKDILPSYQSTESLFIQDESLSSRAQTHESLVDLSETKSSGQTTERAQQLDVAIIGLSGRFPGAEDTIRFWQNLAEGRNSIVDATKERWSATDFYSPKDAPDKSICRWAGLLTGIDQFDPLFFNLSVREAECMDPQQRLFLQEAWAAIEDAGYAGPTLAGQKCGVFVGCGPGDYQQQLASAGVTEAYRFMGNSSSILAARIAYHLNLRGPSIAIDTACSSSLVAIHLACESLRLGTSDMAIAGGVSILTTPTFHILASQTGMLSPQGQCRSFAQGANGFVPGEGVGVVILKALPQALADGDQVYGVIKGSAINQDGKTNGITAPNGPSQTALARAVYEQFDIDPATISYVEAHGTGTALGDPIEVGALTDAFRTYTSSSGYCAIGSVKTNIGHTLGAAGVAGVIKVLLALKHKKLPPSLHFEEPNEQFNFEDSPFSVNTTLTDWSVAAGPRRAAVSSFGFSGTNAHLVIEECQEAELKSCRVAELQGGMAPEKGQPHLIVLSAKNEERLQEYVRKLLLYLEMTSTSRPVAQEPDSFVEPQILRQTIKKIVAEIVGVDAVEIEAEQSFTECGLDGIQLSRLQMMIEEYYRCELPSTLVTPNASVESVAVIIHPLLTSPNLGEELSPRQQSGGSLPYQGRVRVGSERPSLESIAYTLQTGRTAMEERLACVVSTIDELIEQLESYANGKHQRKSRNGTQALAQGVYRGIIESGHSIANLLSHGETGKAIVQTAVQERDWATLAQLWVSGVEIDWRFLYPHGTPKRVSLPTYPFAPERYWIAETKVEPMISRTSARTYKSNGTPQLPSYQGGAEHIRENIPDAGPHLLYSRLLADLKREVSSVTKVSIEQLDASKNLGAFGFDSLMMKKLVVRLEQRYGVELTPTIFFEHSDLNSFTNFLLVTHREAIRAAYHVEAGEMTAHDGRGYFDEHHSTNPQTPAITQPQRVSERVSKQASQHESKDLSKAVAIVGMSGIMPQSPDLDTFWQHLAMGHDLITEIPPERWDWRTVYDPTGRDPQRSVSKWGGFIPDVDKFDPGFFELSPREAEMMDPQQRLFLQTVWQTFENAGYRASDLAGRSVGVYVGVQFQEYNELIALTQKARNAQIATGNAHAMLANRVSFLFDLHGPSEAIDTACSSSLVAIHRAVQSIRSGEIEGAIVGGVSLALSPTTYITTSQMGVLSPDGRCKTFDKGANGYVKGEGVGAVLLKPLAQAEADGDHIYAIIRGSAENHGGRATSLTAPNAHAQAQLLVKAYADAEVDIGTVSYIETHGTGTELGDPVEIEGLKQGFQHLRAQQGQAASPSHYCGLGSVKTNIGHLEPAAGMAGLFKTLLAMHHQTLPATIHIQEQNPYIDLTGSPFYLVTETQKWQPVTDDARQPMPRRAGISSFGFGGAYAHVVLEEYREQGLGIREQGLGNRESQVVVLSAKNKERLREYAHKLLTYLEESSKHSDALSDTLQPATCNLLNIAYTLQTGRAPMEERLAFVVTTTEELIEQLRRYEQLGSELRGSASGDVLTQIYQGNSNKSNQHTAERWLEGAADHTYLIEELIEARELDKLASLWVSGIEIDWHLLYGDERLLRIPLPTYPFAKERYWLPESNGARSNGAGDKASVIEVEIPTASHAGWSQKLHPLVHQNNSDFEAQRFCSIFVGTEFFLKDHRVQGEKVLPGVAYLEMARASGEMAARGQRVIQLKDVVWMRPMVVKEKALEAQIELYPLSSSDNRESGEITFKISSVSSNQPEPVIHSQGKLVVGELSTPALLEMPDPLDISAIKDRCRSTIDGATCYQRFREHGLDHGPTFQGLTQIHSNKDEALAFLRLPTGIVDNSEYLLPPSLLDAALQASLGLAISQDKGHQEVSLPFALGEVNIYGRVPNQVVAHVRYSVHKGTHNANTSNGLQPLAKQTHNGVQPDSQVAKFDIMLADEQGVVCVELKGFMSRAITQKPDIELLYGTPEWQVKPLAESHHTAVEEEPTRTLLLIGLSQDVAALIAGSYPENEVVSLPAREQDEASTVMRLTKESWRLIKDAVEKVTAGQNAGGRPTRSAHHILIVTAGSVAPHLYAPLTGLLKTAQLEQPKIRGKILTVAKSKAERLLTLLAQEIQPNTFEDVEVRYDKSGIRNVKTLRRVELGVDPIAKGANLKPGGTYWITGGLGGLGLIFARHLLASAKVKNIENVFVILSGRSALDEARQQLLAELNRYGGTAIYLQADVSQRQEVEQVVQRIKEMYGTLDGIIHSAGVLCDSFILNKTDAELDAVLAPKIAGVMNIDAATQAESLDFVMLFSSLAGVIGNAGQADYAAANAFLDAFAHHRQTLVEAGQRSGRTIAIDWPLWADGGMAVEPETERWLTKKTGMTPLSTASGLEAFEQALAQNEFVQLLVIQGDTSKVGRSLGVTSANPTYRRETSTITAIEDAHNVSNADDIQDAQDGRGIQSQFEGELIELFADELKIQRADLNTEVNFAKVGVDSLIMMSLLNKIEDKYGATIAPTAIIEYPTIATLASHLQNEGIGPILNKGNNKPSAQEIYEGISGQNGLVRHVNTNGNGTAPQRIAPNEGSASLSQLPLHSQPKSRLRIEPVHSVSGAGSNAGSNKVAIIAQACRLPQSPTVEHYWQNLAAGRNLVTTVPTDRWQADQLYSPQPVQPDKTYTNHGGFVEGIAYFDADFFGIADEDAITMDPQQRVMLELAQELWDRAGYRAEEVNGTRTSVFIGAKDNNYVRKHYDLIPSEARQHTMVHSISNMIAARISDFYNLTGSAEIVDTACSSSLVAVHNACQSILSGEAEMAIAGGIFFLIDAYGHIGFSQAKVLSADGKSYVFDERANGFVLAEGGGLVLLKEYEAAIRDGDPITGVILGSALNNDGQTMGLTVPNQQKQRAVIEAALQRSHISPADIGYLEAHGTGTLLGDPIEIRAATEVYRQYTQERQYCAVGSVKSNLGHTMTAAGITGLSKMLLSLQHQQIPPTLHCENPHPRFRFEESPFYPNTQLRDWVPRNGRRIGAISSFGFGGTNCHLIVEEGNPAAQTRQPQPLTQFKRKRYWLGHEIVPEESNSAIETHYRALIKQLKNGALSKEAFKDALTRLTGEEL
ncbi:MAG: SDR family NAD(P)-dependent oxidoreductase [Chloroflexota bacterium]